MPFSAEELQKIRAELPAKAVKMLSENLGLKANSVSSVLAGRRNNDNVVIAALDLIKDHQEKLKEAKDQIATL